MCLCGILKNWGLFLYGRNICILGQQNCLSPAGENTNQQETVTLVKLVNTNQCFVSTGWSSLPRAIFALEKGITGNWTAWIETVSAQTVQCVHFSHTEGHQNLAFLPHIHNHYFKPFALQCPPGTIPIIPGPTGIKSGFWNNLKGYWCTAE